MSFNAAALPVFAVVEHLWSLEAGWYAHDATASGWLLEIEGAEWSAQGEPEVAERRMDPEEALWFRDLEEAANDGKPRVVIPELSSTESIWQRKKREKKEAAAANAAEKEDDKENGIVQACTSLNGFEHCLLLV